jgi:hypothetical protein
VTTLNWSETGQIASDFDTSFFEEIPSTVVLLELLVLLVLVQASSLVTNLLLKNAVVATIEKHVQIRAHCMFIVYVNIPLSRTYTSNILVIR